MDALKAAEISIKSYLLSLLAGSLLVSLTGCIALRADPFVMLAALLVSLFVGAVIVTFLAAPIYAGLLCAGIANYISSLISALLIAVASYPFGGLFAFAVVACYGVPIALFAHFLAKRERGKPPAYSRGPLPG